MFIISKIKYVWQPSEMGNVARSIKFQTNHYITFLLLKCSNNVWCRQMRKLFSSLSVYFNTIESKSHLKSTCRLIMIKFLSFCRLLDFVFKWARRVSHAHKRWKDDRVLFSRVLAAIATTANRKSETPKRRRSGICNEFAVCIEYKVLNFTRITCSSSD